MSTLKARLPQILQMLKEDLPILLKNAADPLKDRDGCSTSVVKGALRSIGVAEFVLHGSVESFRQNLSNAAKIQLSLFERHRSGEPIDESYLNVLAYKQLFDSLAVGNFETATQLAEHMTRYAKIVRHVHPFDEHLGLAMAETILMNENEARDKIDAFLTYCRLKDKDFIGYPSVLLGILSRDDQQVNLALLEIVKGHKKQAKRGVFKLTDDEVLCVWGVGIANLARHRGLTAFGVDDWIPEKLLI